jgi:hypothetical protein
MSALVSVLRRRWRWLAAVAILVAAYAVLGFLIAPGFVRRQLEQRLGATLHRSVSVAEVRLNPFALSVTILGFQAKDPDGSPFIAFDRLYVNYDLLAILGKEVDLAAVELERPFARVALDARGRLNFQDLLEDAGSAAPEPPSQGGLAVVVRRLRIAGAGVAFSDRSRRRPFESTLGPITLELSNFRTRRKDHESPYSFSGQTESGETFAWSGNVLLDPIRSKGTFTLENVRLPKYATYTQEATPAELRSGTAGLRATYEVEWGPERRVLKLVDGALSIRKLEIARPGAASPAVVLPEIDVTGVHADALEMVAEVGRIAVRGGRIEVRREIDWRLSLLDLLLPPGAPPGSAGAATGTGPKAPGKARRLRYRLGELSVEGVRLAATDLAAPSPVELPVDVQRLALTGFTSDPAAPAGLELALLVDGKGKVSTRGKVLPLLARAELELTVEDLELSPFSPYLNPALDARLEEARLGVGAKITMDAGGPETRWTFAGAVRLDGLRMVDGRRGEEFVRWRSLRLEGLEASPGRLSLAAVRVAEPRLRAAIWEDGTQSLAVIARRPTGPAGAKGEGGKAGAAGEGGRAGPDAARDGKGEGTDAEGATPGAAPAGEVAARPAFAAPGEPGGGAPAPAPAGGASLAGPPPPAAATPTPPPAAGAGGSGGAAKGPGSRVGPSMRWSVGTLQVTRGRASFADRSVKPPAVLEVAELDVLVRGLSSEPRSRARVEATARVGGAPLSVRGSLQPYFTGDATDLAVESKGIDLTPLGPYVAKYAGYELQKGKLDVDLRYTVKSRTLAGENLARIDQFTLGEAVESPDATKLPVKLGLAVLTDKDGVISLDVPVGGSVDDPDFSIGRMVWRAIVNVLTKVMLSPFRVLGGLFGGGAPDLDVLDFAPGEAALDEAAEKKLAALEKALRERPALRLDVEGVADAAVDGSALRRAAVREAARRAKWAALHRKDAALALDAVTLAPEEYPRWLEAAYRALPPPPAGGEGGKAVPAAPEKKGSPPLEEMEDRLAAAGPPGAEAYRELASGRAEAARARLLRDGAVDAGRVFLAEGGERARKDRGARAYFTLK